MDYEQNAGTVGAAPVRPAADAAIANRERSPLTAPRSGQRVAARIGAVDGIVVAALVAICCALPWAIGVLIFQGPASWQSSLARWALLLAAAAVVLGAGFVWVAQVSSKGVGGVGAGTHAGRSLAFVGFDTQAATLLRRTRDAIGTVRSSEVCQAGLLDAAAYGAALADQEREIALTLRQQSELRQARAQLPAIRENSPAREMLDRQHESAHLAEQSVAGRIAALEQLAVEVLRADNAYRDWRALAAVSELADRHLDMLARTAADSHAIAEISVMSQQARDLHFVLRDLPLR